VHLPPPHHHPVRELGGGGGRGALGGVDGGGRGGGSVQAEGFGGAPSFQLLPLVLPGEKERGAWPTCDCPDVRNGVC
jgi:hypothetical protein